MASDARAELQSLWDEHSSAPFPSGWGDVEGLFGEADTWDEVREVPDAARLERMWGSPDLHLYDSYIAGHVSTVLGRSELGGVTVGGLEPDARLARYFDVCLAEATDETTRRKVHECMTYYDRLNRMLSLVRRVAAAR